MMLANRLKPGCYDLPNNGALRIFALLICALLSLSGHFNPALAQEKIDYSRMSDEQWTCFAGMDIMGGFGGCFDLGKATHVQKETGGSPGPTDTNATAQRLETYQFFDQACNSGSFAACYFVQGYKADDNYTVRDITLAHVYERAGCVAGLYFSCPAIPDVKTKSIRREMADRADDPNYIPTFQTYCDQGVGLACYSLADAILARQAGSAADQAQAIALYQRGCEAGFQRACFHWADAIYQGQYGQDKNTDLATRLMLKSCRMGEAKSCTAIAKISDKGDGSFDVLALPAADYYFRACGPKNMMSCVMVARIYLSDSGNSKHVSLGMKAHETGCDAGHALNCYELGLQYHSGDNLPRDRAKSARYFLKACDLDDKLGCFNAAVQYHNGDSVTQSSYLAKILFEKSCRLGFKPACKAVK